MGLAASERTGTPDGDRRSNFYFSLYFVCQLLRKPLPAFAGYEPNSQGDTVVRIVKLSSRNEEK